MARSYVAGAIRRSDPFLAEIKQLREKADLTQTQAAQKMECSLSTMIRLENGITPFRKADLVFLLDLYGVQSKRKIDALVSQALKRRDQHRKASRATA